MKICGLKLTHDCSVAVIEDGRLLCCHELEKIGNNARFSLPDSIQSVAELVKTTGYMLPDFETVVIDGWVGQHETIINLGDTDEPDFIRVAGYQEICLSEDLLQSDVGGKLNVEGKEIAYTSYKHVLGHILSAYCTSPFAKNREEAYALVWDGGMFPRLYHVLPAENRIRCLGELFCFGVNIYSIFAQHFRPFKINANVIKDELSIAGKVMAYTAFGKVQEEIIDCLQCAEQSCFLDGAVKKEIPTLPYSFTKKFKQLAASANYNDEDIIASFHEYLKRKLVINLYEKIAETGRATNNLCLSGGAALNIKWNSAIRLANTDMNIYVCPFPNDSGSAIGAACAAYVKATGSYHIDWNIYSGPMIENNCSMPGWTRQKTNAKEIAGILHETQLPLVLLSGRAELGPRALGNRSIIASPSSPAIQDALNAIKYRESYRPVAPVCMEEMASEIFFPGGSDPFMLFDHKVKDEWRSRIPGVIHFDGTARLQTLNGKENPVLYSILKEYHLLSGIPVLCNTSANFKGSGFFPDITSAKLWGKVKYIFDGEYLYTKTG